MQAKIYVKGFVQGHQGSQEQSQGQVQVSRFSSAAVFPFVGYRILSC